MSKFFPLILPKKHSLITQKRFWPFFLVFSGFLGDPSTIYFGGLSLYFDNFFARKTVGSRETPQDGLLIFNLSISHFNLAYVDLCKFTLFDKPLQRGFVACFLQLLKKDVCRPSNMCFDKLLQYGLVI